MPADFTRCQNSGGRIRTKSMSGGRYMPICFDGEGSHAGYVHRKGEKKKEKSARDRVIDKLAAGHSYE